jgi:hypothetical protein
VVVCEAAIAMDLDKVGKQTLDEIFEAGTARMTGDQHPLPRRECGVEVRPDRFDAASQRRDLAFADLRLREQREGFDLLQQDGDRFFELERFSTHGRACLPSWAS